MRLTDKLSSSPSGCMQNYHVLCFFASGIAERAKTAAMQLLRGETQLPEAPLPRGASYDRIFSRGWCQCPTVSALRHLSGKGSRDLSVSRRVRWLLLDVRSVIKYRGSLLTALFPSRELTSNVLGFLRSPFYSGPTRLPTDWTEDSSDEQSHHEISN
jgi:hypothetical protein